MVFVVCYFCCFVLFPESGSQLSSNREPPQWRDHRGGPSCIIGREKKSVLMLLFLSTGRPGIRKL